MKLRVNYLFAESDIRSQESVALAIDGGISTPTNSIHFPVSIVIVHHMEVTMSTSTRFKYPTIFIKFYSYNIYTYSICFLTDLETSIK